MRFFCFLIGQHGVALATAAAYFGLECEIHMGEIDIAKEAPNVTRMKLLGAEVVGWGFGSACPALAPR